MPPNFMDITDDLGARAFNRASDLLRKLDELRGTLDLPSEQLPLVIDLYAKSVEALLVERERADLDARTKRLPLNLRIESNRSPYQLNILPKQSVQITETTPFASFRPEEFRIHGDAARWVVHDIKIANRSQFLGRGGPIPGAEFSAGGVCAYLRLETMYSGATLQLTAEYIGPIEEGEVFEATIVGTAVEHPRTEPS